MKKNKLFIFFILIFLFPTVLFAQDITGIWKGTIYNDSTKKTIPYQLAITTGKDGNLNGYSYTEFIVNDTKALGVKKIAIKINGDKIYIADIGLVSNSYPVKPPKNIHQYSVLTLGMQNGVPVLSGNWNTNLTKQYRPVTGTLSVQRQSAYDTTFITQKINTIAAINEQKNSSNNQNVAINSNVKTTKIKDIPLPQIVDTVAAKDIYTRKMGSDIKKVYYKNDSLVLSLYDNGIVDGDIVSVMMNGKLIFSKQMLSTIANNKTIYITKDTPDSILITLYAENLGSIPPNTGLLTVHDGELEYDVFFSADLQTNAGVMLIRKKDEPVQQQ